MTRRPCALVLALFLLPLTGERPGGWAVVTLDDLPDYVEAGKPVILSFMVRQHGVTRLAGVRPTVEARSGSHSAIATATPGEGTGRYAAELRLPDSGDWTITINSGFMASRLTLLPLRAIPAGTAAPEAPAENERGRHLFVAKGCTSCHTRNDVDVGAGGSFAPELTGKRDTPEFLRRFLADPAANATHTGSFRMPNLGLSRPEIASLIAFLNAENGRAIGTHRPPPAW